METRKIFLKMVSSKRMESDPYVAMLNSQNCKEQIKGNIRIKQMMYLNCELYKNAKRDWEFPWNCCPSTIQVIDHPSEGQFRTPKFRIRTMEEETSDEMRRHISPKYTEVALDRKNWKVTPKSFCILFAWHMYVLSYVNKVLWCSWSWNFFEAFMKSRINFWFFFSSSVLIKH